MKNSINSWTKLASMSDAVLLQNGRFYTGFSPSTQLQSMLICDGRIHSLGAEEDIDPHLRHQSQRIDLQGKTVWPGLTDSHLHLANLAYRLAAVDCETDSLAECLLRVQQAAQSLPEDAWVIGYGWNHNAWQPARYGTVEELDAVCGGRPAVLYAKSLHASWVNSAALRLAGLTDASVDPPGGKLQRNADGALSGILLENAMALVDQVIPPLEGSHLQALLKQAQTHLLSIGITSVHDFDGLDCLEALQALEANGKLRMRVCKNLPGTQIEEVAQLGLKSSIGSELLRLGWLKLFADGALGPQTAAMLAPYEGSTSQGILLMDADAVYEQGVRAAALGLPLAIHAIGDAAVRAVLDGFERLRAYESAQHLPHLPHRIEHAQLVAPEDLPRFKALNIHASVQPIHATSDMEMAEKYWGKRCVHAYAYASLREHGASLLAGSDAPVESANPFWGLHAAVTRQRRNGNPGPDGWHPEQSLSLDAALVAYTLNPAQACGLGNAVGKIAPGYNADLIVLSRDPFSCDPTELWKVQPEMTLIDGEIVFQR
jgi:hypothetical protein